MMKWKNSAIELPEIDPDDTWKSRSKRLVVYSQFGVGFGYYHPKLDEWTIEGVHGENFKVFGWFEVEDLPDDIRALMQSKK